MNVQPEERPSDYDGPEWAAPESARRIRLRPVAGRGPQVLNGVDLIVVNALAAGHITAEQFQTAMRIVK